MFQNSDNNTCKREGFLDISEQGVRNTSPKLIPEKTIDFLIKKIISQEFIYVTETIGTNEYRLGFKKAHDKARNQPVWSYIFGRAQIQYKNTPLSLGVQVPASWSSEFGELLKKRMVLLHKLDYLFKYGLINELLDDNFYKEELETFIVLLKEKKGEKRKYVEKHQYQLLSQTNFPN